MKLKKVTITGADDSTSVEALKALTAQYPFVEWGILFGTGTLDQPRPRFPGRKWVRSFLHEIPPSHSCAHLCGKWVRDLVIESLPSFFGVYQHGRFGRVQLNFHGQFHRAHPEIVGTLGIIQSQGVGVIFQFDSVNDAAAAEMVRLGLGAPLFDISGGAGILPESWPASFSDFSGYAGGLSPENVVEQIANISAVAGDSDVWIDVETRVRTSDDSQLDMLKVERFLHLAAPFVDQSGS